MQELLWHSSSEITRGTYLHSVPMEARIAVERVEDYWSKRRLDPQAHSTLLGIRVSDTKLGEIRVNGKPNSEVR